VVIYPMTVSCPHCGAITYRRGYPGWVIIVAIVFFPVGLLALLVGRDPSFCDVCGHKWFP
jgi:hypothetical protein